MRDRRLSDYLVCGILLFLCLCYSILSRQFAQLCIVVPIVHLPVFVGEIALFLSLAIVCIRELPINKINGNKAITVLVVLYGVFVVAKALSGYFAYGILAFRHAALFYYPFFGLVAYQTRHVIEGKKYTLWLLGVLCAIILSLRLPYYYFNYTYLCLTILLVLCWPNKFVKFFSIAILFIVFPYNSLFMTSRANLIGVVTSLLVLSCIIFLQHQRKAKMFSAILFGIFCFVLIGAVYLVPRTEIINPLVIKEIVNDYIETRAYVDECAKTYVPPKLPVRLYTPENEKAFNNIGIRSDIVEMPSAIEQRKVEYEQLKNMTKKTYPGGSYNDILWRILVADDMIRELLAGNIAIGEMFGKPFRSKSIEILGWNKSEIEGVGWLEPHNSYVHYIYRSGIVGCVFLFFFIAFCIKTIMRVVKMKSFTAAVLVSVLVYWFVIANFMVLFELPFFAIPVWCLLGFTAGYIRNKEEIWSK